DRRGDVELPNVDSPGFGDADEFECDSRPHVMTKCEDRRPAMLIGFREFVECSCRNLRQRTQRGFKRAVLAAGVLEHDDVELFAKYFREDAIVRCAGAGMRKNQQPRTCWVGRLVELPDPRQLSGAGHASPQPDSKVALQVGLTSDSF